MPSVQPMNTFSKYELMEQDSTAALPTRKGKGKAVPLQAWSGPEGSRKLRFPDYITVAQDGGKGKGKAVPLQAWSGPEGSRKLRFPDFMTTAEDGGKVVSLTHRPPLPSANTPGTHFCYRLSRPQGHNAIGRILCQ